MPSCESSGLTTVIRSRSVRKANPMKSKTIKVDCLARVEGKGSLYVKISENRPVDVKFKIFEPPRLFEAFLRGRHFSEVPDITARICGICPIAYQTSSATAMEDALGIQVEGQLRALRRLIYYGEWIESHALHVYLLHAPDFLGYEDAIRMAKDYPDLVKQGLQVKKVGNELMILLGGREIHPINMRVGGFYSVPKKKDFTEIIEALKWARDAAYETVRWTATLPFPDFEQDYEFVSLRHPEEYPLIGGRLVSNKGLDISLQEYNQCFVEEHIPYSNALHSGLKGRGSYHVGPLARYNLNFDRLSPLAQEAPRGVGLGPVCRNPFQSIIVRSLETLHACDDALRLIDQYEMPDHPFIPAQPRAAIGFGCSEAPRGFLVHRYRIDERGLIQDAKIVPPTSQNQKCIEDDLLRFISKNIDLPHDKLTWQAEQAIRNYDPCISCATHFLKLDVRRE